MLTSTSAAGHISQIVWATEHHDVEFAKDGRHHLRDMQASHNDPAALLRQ